MAIFAISDLHLSFGVSGKDQSIFGEPWVEHWRKIREKWEMNITEQDVVLLGGDLSWAGTVEQVKPDLAFVHSLPGEKIIIKGNHDYWWPKSRKKLHKLLPSSIRAIQSEAIFLGEAIVCGTRLWDMPGISFDDLISWKRYDTLKKQSIFPGESTDRVREQEAVSQRLYFREILRLERALEDLEKLSQTHRGCPKICLLHFPPRRPGSPPNEVSTILDRYPLDVVLFGHLHSVKKSMLNSPFYTNNGTNYYLTSADYLDFTPLRVVH